MSVKRYEFELYHCNGGEMLVSDTGDYVSYEDYAALEARCAELAAENAGLKDAISSHAAGFTVCEACGEENISGNDDVCRALNETQATDAFLAEVRAQGVDMVIAYHQERADALREVDLDGSFRHKTAALDAGDVADQLRQGAAQ